MIAGVEIENVSRDPDHAYFRDGLSSERRKLGIDIVYSLYAKFDDSSFSRSRDIIGGPKI